MIHLKIKTGFTFQKAFGTIDKIIKTVEPILLSAKIRALGIADQSTWGHVSFFNVCKKHKIKPILGVQIGVINGNTLKRERQPLNYMTLIAKNNKGLKELYHIVNKAYSNFYYVPRLCIKDIQTISENTWILSGDRPHESLLKLCSKKNFLLEASPGFPYFWNNNLTKLANKYKFKIIATADNYYPAPEDENIYNAVAGRMAQALTSVQHIPTEGEMKLALPMIPKEAFSISDTIAKEIKIDLPQGKNITFKNVDLKKACAKGWKDREIPDRKVYRDRLKRELEIIKEKGYEGYFHLVADVVNHAKKEMLVGPARGSAAGSLVSYLMGITDVDPIKFELIFERFIDITRMDLPDIDIDFPDNKRGNVIKYLSEKYGAENVSHIGTISRYMPKAALSEMAKLSSVPGNRLELLKKAMIERQSGDDRANKCIEDTFATISTGQQFISDFPQMSLAAEVEGHPRHSGVHAAGILICNTPVKNFCGVDPLKNIAMIDKKGAEELNLLKLDVLGLRTLTVLNTVLELKKLDRKFLLDLPLDDKKSFEIIQKEKWVGVFQFEGYTLQTLARQMGIETFNDIVAVTALARPGPLHSGGAAEFVSKKTGESKATYIHKFLKPITEETYGVLVFQEQIMKICRDIGQMDWADISTLRRIMGKTEGKEAFNKFWKKFKVGAQSRKVPLGDAKRIWEAMVDFGSYAFNKSHSVSYGLLSYWCCYLKAHYPLEFALACLINEKDSDSTVWMLRELVREGFEYIPIDRESSEINWSIKNNKLIGGLTNIKGVGVKKAQEIIGRRKNNLPLTKGLAKLLDEAKTPFDDIFECERRFGDYYINPQEYRIESGEPIYIKHIHKPGTYIFIGKLKEKILGDMNEFTDDKDAGKNKKNLFLKLTFEDDTGKIYAGIDRWRFEKIGKSIAETENMDHWFIIKGVLRKGWRKINIERIRSLGK